MGKFHRTINMIYLFVALKIEASAIINYYKLKKISFNHFENDKIYLKICGVGERNFLSSLSLIKTNKDDKIINFGICGAGNLSLKIGELINISKIQNSNKNYTLKKSVNLKNLTLQSFANPINDDKNLNCDVVDMEAFCFFEFFKNYECDIKIIKIVSDYLDSEIPKKEFIYGIINKKMAILNREFYGE